MHADKEDLDAETDFNPPWLEAAIEGCLFVKSRGAVRDMAKEFACCCWMSWRTRYWTRFVVKLGNHQSDGGARYGQEDLTVLQAALSGYSFKCQSRRSMNQTAK